MIPPCRAIPFITAVIVSSETPVWRKAPEKSPFVKACVFLRKPSVLSEFERSAEATIIFSTFLASNPRTADDAALVADPSF